LNADLKVPNLAGLSSQEAVDILETLGLKAELIGSGNVREQNPQAGSVVTMNQKIILELS
jgi:beta-lactam-binding protein with PASTA domain